jgi:hypothetical protein
MACEQFCSRARKGWIEITLTFTSLSGEAAQFLHRQGLFPQGMKRPWALRFLDLYMPAVFGKQTQSNVRTDTR